LLAFLLVPCLSRVQAQGQSKGKEKITVSFTNTHLVDVLAAIEKQTHVRLTYIKADLADIVLPVFKVKEVTIKAALDELCKKAPLEYTLLSSSAAIRKKILPVKKQAPAQTRSPGTGILRGRVVDFETSQPLPGATITLAGTSKRVLTDEKGYYRFRNLPPGEYRLVTGYTGYSDDSTIVKAVAGKETSQDIKMQAGGRLQEVVVSSAGRKVRNVTHTTERQLVAELKNSQSVVSGISSEQISKSADRNAAQVMQRISGVTIKDEKFVIVRGMDERYNLTYLNDNIAPSTEQYSRSFDLSLIPSRIIDKILVYKSPAPDLQGDMTGGAVRIYTKDAKNVKHLDIELQVGVRPGTTLNKHFLTYQGGKYDFLGIDDGTRKLPSSVPGYGNFNPATISQSTYVHTFSPILQYGEETALPNLQLIANYYNSWKLGRYNLSSLTSFNYKNELQQSDVYKQQGNTGDGSTSGTNAGTGFNDRLYFQNLNTAIAQLNLLQNFTLRLRDSSHIQFKNFLLQQGQNTTMTQVSTPNIFANGQPSLQGDLQKNIELGWTQRFLYAGNFGGLHYFNRGNQNIQWNAGYTYSHQEIPDQRVINLHNTGGGSRSFSMSSVVNNGVETYGDSSLNWTAADRSNSGSVEYGMISRLWVRNTEECYCGL
jgi:hypothetical protein